MRRKPKYNVPVKTGLNDSRSLQFLLRNIFSHGAHADNGIETACADEFFLEMQTVAFQLDVQLNASAASPMFQDIVESIGASWNNQGNVVQPPCLSNCHIERFEETIAIGRRRVAKSLQ